MKQNDEIEILINNLSNLYSENIPIEIQEFSINKLSEIIKDEDLYRLVLPKNHGCWDNSAEVLKKIGFPRILKVADKMMVWLADLNWPGSVTIYNLFLSLDLDALKPIIERALIEADKDKDTIWIYWINRLIEEKGIKEKFDSKFQIIMAKED